MKKGFTLIELLVAIGIFVIMLSIILYFFNPIEFAKRQRDIKRINDLNSLASAIQTCISVNPNCNLGPNDSGYDEGYPTIFISAPFDNNIPSTTTDAMGKIWIIKPADPANLYNINGTGWLPVDFSTLKYSPLSSLPVDPINSFSQKYFYSYVFRRDTNEFEINANLEFDEFKKGGKNDKTSKDGGSDLEIFEVGNNKCLIYNNLYGPITTSTCGYIKEEQQQPGQGGELIGGIILNNTTGTIWGMDSDGSYIYFVGRLEEPRPTSNPDWGVGKIDFNLSNPFITSSIQSPASAFPDNPFDVKVYDKYLYIGGQLAQPAPGIGDFSWIEEERDKNDLSLSNIVTLNINATIGSPDSINAVAVDKNGNVYFAGKDCLQGDCEWRIEKRGEKLTWDTVATSNPSSGDDEALDTAVDDNYIYVIGYQTVYSPVTSTAWRIEKRDKNNLSLVTSIIFDTSGDDKANAIAIDDNYLYIVGQQGGAWRIEKRDKNLNLIWATTSDPTLNSDIAYGVAIDCEGIYIAGAQSVDSSPYWRIEKRDLYTGALVFATTSDSGIAYDIVVNDYGIFVGGYKGNPARWAIEKRNRGAPKCKTTFYQTFSKELLYEAGTTTDGYFVLAGEILTATYSDAIIEKIDREGKIVTSYTFGGNYADGFRSIIVDGDYYVGAGFTYSYGTGTPISPNAYIVKIDKNGNKIWEQYFDFGSGDYSGDYFNQIKKDKDGNYVAVGNRIVKINPATGTLLWSSDLGVSLNSIDITNDGNYIVGGYKWIGEEAFAALISSSTGNVICSSTLTYPGYQGDLYSQGGIGSIIQASSGEFLGVENYWKYQIWQSRIIKIQPDCSWNDVKSYYNTFMYDIIQNKDLNYVISGYQWLYGYGLFLKILDNNFNEKINRSYPTQEGVWFSSIIQTPDNGYLIVGNNRFIWKTYLIKTDEKGNYYTIGSISKFFDQILKTMKALFYRF